MGVFLVQDGTNGAAVGLMAVVLAVALLGVAALGWYVVHCDIQNRHAERELLSADSHGSTGLPAEAHALQAPTASAPEVIAAETPADPSLPVVVRHRRKGR